MITVADLTVALGGGLVTVILDRVQAEVDDVVIAEAGMQPFARPGDLVLGVGLREVGEAVGRRGPEPQRQQSLDLRSPDGGWERNPSPSAAA